VRVPVLAETGIFFLVQFWVTSDASVFDGPLPPPSDPAFTPPDPDPGGVHPAASIFRRFLAPCFLLCESREYKLTANGLAALPLGGVHSWSSGTALILGSFQSTL
jgi:hypothetical protein